MKFSSAALAVLPFVAFTQLVSRTKAASTKGLTIADGMVVELCNGSSITVDNENYWSAALIVGDFPPNQGASLTITGGSYTSKYFPGMEVKGGSNATVLGGMIQGGKDAGGYGISVDTGAVATVLGGMIQGGLHGYGMFVEEGAVATVLGGMIQGGKNGDGMYVNYRAVATVLGGMIEGGKYGSGMSVNFGAVATVLGGTIQGGEYLGYGMVVNGDGAVATVCDGTIQGGTGSGSYNYGVYVHYNARVHIAGGMMIGGNSTVPGYGFINIFGDATITGGTFKGGFNSTSGDQAPSLALTCGNTSIYGGTYEGHWRIDSPVCDDSYTKVNGTVYGKDLVVKDSHLMGTLCDGNLIDVYILEEPSTLNIENNCTSFPKFAECGGKGGKSGKKTLFRP